MRSIVSLTFDDGLRCQFTSALPILNDHGMRATFFLIANRNPTHDLWSGHTEDWWKIEWSGDDIAILRRLVEDGHEIGSHSVTHHPTDMPKQPDLEARESKKLIEGWLGTRVSSFCYPFYRSHAFLADAVKEAGYEQARGGGAAPRYEPGASYYSTFDAVGLDQFNVDCRQISKNEDVGGWLRPGYWHVLTFHAVGDERDGWEPISVEEFAAQIAQLAALRDSGAVDVLTFAAAAARLREGKCAA